MLNCAAAGEGGCARRRRYVFRKADPPINSADSIGNFADYKSQGIRGAKKNISTGAIFENLNCTIQTMYADSCYAMHKLEVFARSLNTLSKMLKIRLFLPA